MSNTQTLPAVAGQLETPVRPLVERLRAAANANGPEWDGTDSALMREAANELAQAAERERFLHAATRDAQEFASMYGDEFLRWRRMAADLLPVAETGGESMPEAHAAVVRRARSMLGM